MRGVDPVSHITASSQKHIFGDLATAKTRYSAHNYRPLTHDGVTPLALSPPPPLGWRLVRQVPAGPAGPAGCTGGSGNVPADYAGALVVTGSFGLAVGFAVLSVA